MKLTTARLKKLIREELSRINEKNSRMEPYARQQDTDFSVPMEGTLSYGRGGQYVLLKGSVEIQGKPFQFQAAAQSKGGLDLEQVMQNPSEYADELAKQMYPSFSNSIGEYAGSGYESTLSYDLFRNQLKNGLEQGTIKVT